VIFGVVLPAELLTLYSLIFFSESSLVVLGANLAFQCIM